MKNLSSGLFEPVEIRCKETLSDKTKIIVVFTLPEPKKHHLRGDRCFRLVHRCFHPLVKLAAFLLLVANNDLSFKYNAILQIVPFCLSYAVGDALNDEYLRQVG